MSLATGISVEAVSVFASITKPALNVDARGEPLASETALDAISALVALRIHRQLSKYIG